MPAEETVPAEAVPELDMGDGLDIPSVPSIESPVSDAVIPEDITLRSFHDYSGITPLSYLPAAEGSSSYSVTYACDAAIIDGYIGIFLSNGWVVQDGGADAVASYTFIAAPDYSNMFYVTRMLDGSAVMFTYDLMFDYGFDPVNGL